MPGTVLGSGTRSAVLRSAALRGAALPGGTRSAVLRSGLGGVGARRSVAGRAPTAPVRSLVHVDRFFLPDRPETHHTVANPPCGHVRPPAVSSPGIRESPRRERARRSKTWCALSSAGCPAEQAVRGAQGPRHAPHAPCSGRLPGRVQALAALTAASSCASGQPAQGGLHCRHALEGLERDRRSLLLRVMEAGRPSAETPPAR